MSYQRSGFWTYLVAKQMKPGYLWEAVLEGVNSKCFPS